MTKVGIYTVLLKENGQALHILIMAHTNLNLYSVWFRNPCDFLNLLHHGFSCSCVHACAITTIKYALSDALLEN